MHVLKNINEYNQETINSVNAVSWFFSDIKFIILEDKSEWENELIKNVIEKNWRIIGTFIEQAPYLQYIENYYIAIKNVPVLKKKQTILKKH